MLPSFLSHPFISNTVPLNAQREPSSLCCDAIGTEVVMAARSTGTNWVPTSGIEGELVFANASQTWTFQIRFANSFNNMGARKCNVDATPLKYKGNWRITREIIDHHNNYEVFVTIDKSERVGMNGLADTIRSLGSPGQTEPSTRNTNSSQEGDDVEGRLTASDHKVPRMTGYLSLLVIGLQGHWLKRWCELTSEALTLFVRPGTTPPGLEIQLKDVTKVRAIPNSILLDGHHYHVFDIYSSQRKPVRLGCANMAMRDEWIRQISDAKGRDIAEWMSHTPLPLQVTVEKKANDSTPSNARDINDPDSAVSKASGTPTTRSASVSFGGTADNEQVPQTNGGHSLNIDDLV